MRIFTFQSERCIILIRYFREVMRMTEYLKKYMAETEKRLKECSNSDELEKILSEHKDKIAFMQHERIVHFLVTMLFALVLAVFISVSIFEMNIALLVLDVIILVLLAFYIKHYYFLENTVQKMYRVYDEILLKKNQTEGKND